MKSKNWDGALLAAHREYIQDDAVQAAFDTLVERGIGSPDYQVEPGMHGSVRDFRYMDVESANWPYSFIPNRRHLLFYVRLAGLARVQGGFAALRERFPSTRENSIGEWTVRIETPDEADRLTAFLFRATGTSSKARRGIPEGITREDVIGALARLDEGAVHQFAESVKYDVLYEGRRYAPKAVLGLAAERLAGRQLGPYDFTGGEESQSFRILRKLEFDVVRKDGSKRVAGSEQPWRTDPVAAGRILNDILQDLPDETRRKGLGILHRAIQYARDRFPDRWVVTLQPRRVRLIAGMVMSLQFVKGGEGTILLLKSLAPKPLWKGARHYQNAPGCIETSPSAGALIFEYPDRRAAHEAAMSVCAATHGGTGGHRRAHSPGVVEYLDGLLAADLVPKDPEEAEVARIWTRPDLSVTEKEALVTARRGQGLFRANVATVEPCCRVTGVLDLEYLRASHMKPWRACSNPERLSGDNGLLLAPHIDHLFDRGFISFTDVGDLLVSPNCPPRVLEAWGVPATLNVRPFRSAQRPFLRYHREHCFQHGGAITPLTLAGTAA